MRCGVAVNLVVNYTENPRKMGKILRDEIASGRGVHRKMGVRIQKSRSNFRGNRENHVFLGFWGLV